jgi:hypothetical protein
MSNSVELADLIGQHFNVGSDCYSYTLTRDKEAFWLGVMSTSDFVEFGDEECEELAGYLEENGVVVSSSGCHFCNNAAIDPELTPDNDLSYVSVGECLNQVRILFRSGDRKPTALLFEKWREGYGWTTIGDYIPKFCPECGRKLVENGD